MTALDVVLPTLDTADIEVLRVAALPLLNAWASHVPDFAPDLNILTPVVPSAGIALAHTLSAEGGIGTVSGILVPPTTAGSDWRIFRLQDIDGSVEVVESAYASYADGLSALGGGLAVDESVTEISGEEVTFFERYTGERLPFADYAPANPEAGLDAVGDFTNLLRDRQEVFAVRLALQGPLGDQLFPGVDYDATEDRFTLSDARQLIPSYEAILGSLPADGDAALTELQGWKPILDIVIGGLDRGDGLVNSYNYLFGNIVAAYETVDPNIDIRDAANELGVPKNRIVAGEGVLNGTSGDDIFYVTNGNTLVAGGQGFDSYVFGREFGDVVVDDVEAMLTEQVDDVIRFADYASGDFTATREGLDLILAVTGTDNVVRVKNQFTGSTPGLFGGDFSPDNGVAEISFADGVNWNRITMAQAVSHPGEGDETVIGTASIDWLDGGAGNDFLSGGDNGDGYVFAFGYGQDSIHENVNNILIDLPDFVEFGAGVRLDDLEFVRNGPSDDLTIRLTGTDDELTIIDQFEAAYTGPLGKQWLDRIEFLSFETGRTLDWQSLMTKMVADAKTEGDDEIYGFDVTDRLDGGAGDDLLSGGNESDTYIFSIGYGHDTIRDAADNILASDTDRIEFGAGITPDMIRLSRNGASKSLAISIEGHADQLTIDGQFDHFHTGVFGVQNWNEIERFVFEDGTVWTESDVRQRLLNQMSTDGDDVIHGYVFSERLNGGAGNDTLSGGDGNDIYVYDAGYGNDLIVEQLDNHNFSDFDIVEFGPGLTAADMDVSRNGDALVFTVQASGETLTIGGQFDNYIGFTDHDVEEFRFADGLVWNKSDIQSMLLASTDGDDTITAFHTADTLAGGLGNDTLYGADGSDTYLFNIGDGQDTIHESVEFANISDNDRLIFGANIAPTDVSVSRSGNALTLSIAGTSDSVTVSGQFAHSSWFSWNDIEHFEFADGTVWSKRDVANMVLGGTSGDDNLVGTFQNDELDGREGDDVLSGGDGSDFYYFGVGYGSDIIFETVTDHNLSENDKVIFNAGIVPDGVHYARNGDQLIISLSGSADKLTIDGQFYNYVGFTDRDVEAFEFADGTVITKSDVQALLTIGTAANETITGFHTSDRIDGGAGNDILRGADGADTYVFGRGSGNDIIQESVEYTTISDADRIEFTEGLASADVTFARDGTNLMIAINDTSDTLTIEGAFAVSGDTQSFTWTDIEYFDFADGETLTKKDVQNLLLLSTDGDDTIDGFWTSDVIEGGLGNDLLRGGRGDDGYIYNVGDGDDVISDFRNYWGNDGDYVQLGAGITPNETVVRKSSTDANDVVLTFDNLTGSITLDNQVNGGREWTIDQIRFDDGTIWDKDEIAGRLVSGQATSGDDVINGTSGVDNIFGGAGNDTLRGNNGGDRLNGGLGNDLLEGGKHNDVYEYELGGGHDIISEFHDYWGSYDRIDFGAGIDADDLLFTRDGEHLVIDFEGNDGSIKIYHQLTGGYASREWGINELRFDDGTIWSRGQLDRAYIAQQATDGDDLVYGTSRDDVEIRGGPGNDDLFGNAGNDSYFFELGDGQDRIFENESKYGSGGNDRLVFGLGITLDDLLVSKTGQWHDLTIAIAGTNDSIFLDEVDASEHGRRYNRIETFVFQTENADGSITQTSISESALQALRIEQETTEASETIIGSRGDDRINAAGGNDSLRGWDGNDHLHGGTGDDYLNGAAGHDTYYFNLGDGVDRIYEGENRLGNGGSEKLIFGVGIDLEMLTLTDLGADYLIEVGVQGDSITIQGQDTSYRGRTYNRVERFIFQTEEADGTITQETLTYDELKAAYADLQSNSGQVEQASSIEAIGAPLTEQAFSEEDMWEIGFYTPSDGPDHHMTMLEMA
ncbi:calcium-binding protein [Pacificimonas pallii]|nr:calcium-binding protein [Pacificimonas pallii]